MEILKETQVSGENKVIVGATGPGKTTDIDTLLTYVNHWHPGGNGTTASSNVIESMKRVGDITVMDRAEISISTKI